MLKLAGVMDEDPFDYKTWSGSSRYFFNALKEHDALTDAISAQPSKIAQRLCQLQSIHTDIEKWKFAYHLNTNLFNSMSSIAKQKIQNITEPYDAIVQVGAWYDLIDLNIINTSYHDGNLATRLASPFGYPKISKSRINKALNYEKKLYSQLDLIFPMSHWLAKSFISDFGADEKKVIPVGAGINLSKIKNTDNRTYDHKRLLMVGKDFKRKGGKTLLSAFKKVKKEIPDIELRIIGPKLDDIPEGVTCLGFLSKNNPDDLDVLLEEYSKASIFVIPSLYEPFGISFVEAMAHRVPCIGTNICAMPEIIQHGSTGFVVAPNNDAELADRIIELLQSEELMKEMGDNGYTRYLNNYTWEIVTSKMLTAINDIN